MNALSHLWSTDSQIVKFETPEEWRKFWEERSPTVGSAVEVAKLEPLYTPQPGSYVIVHE